MDLITSGSSRLRIDSSGRVLIATTSGTQGQVSIFNATDFSTASISNTSDNIFLISDATSGDGVYGASIGFSRVQYADRRAAAIATVQEGSDEDNVGLAFFTHPAANASDPIVEALRITSGGKIGVNYAATPPSETMMISSGDSTTALSASHLSGGNRYGFRLSTISGTNTGMTFSTFANSSYSEKLVIDGNGVLLVGHTSSPTSDSDKLQVISTSSGTGLCLHNYSASAYGNQIAFMKSRNNTIGSNTILNSGDRIGELNFLSLIHI